jgi:hypothetical protein
MAAPGAPQINNIMAKQESFRSWTGIGIRTSSG